MKKNSLQKNAPLFISSLLIIFGGCSSVNNDVETLSNEDIDLATHIVTSSVADDESGIISGLYDAFSNVSEDGISYGNKKYNNGGRGHEKNYIHSYDPETGIHNLSYSRSIDKESFSKSIEISQAIIYTDLDGTFIELPEEHKDSIEAISYVGLKVGSRDGESRSSSFTKTDNYNLSGVHANSAILSLDGTHVGSGSAQGITSDDEETSRTYDINISYENVTINKDTVEAYGSMEHAVSGTLTYSTTMVKTIDGVADEEIVEGTIDLNEDGTALMRFNKFPKVIRFALSNGERKDGRKGNGSGF